MHLGRKNLIPKFGRRLTTSARYLRAIHPQQNLYREHKVSLRSPHILPISQWTEDPKLTNDNPSNCYCMRDRERLDQVALLY